MQEKLITNQICKATIMSLVIATLSALPALANNAADVLLQIEHAEAQFSSGKWDSAAESYRALLNDNPYKGEYWSRLGRAEYALGRNQHSLEAYLKANALGYEPKTTALGAAINYIALGDGAAAAKQLAIAVRLDPGWANLLPQAFSEITATLSANQLENIFGPFADKEMTRDERWRTDLAFLEKHLLRSHYDAFAHTTEADWSAAARDIATRIPRLSDAEIALEMTRFVALAGDGHTNIWYSNESPIAMRRLPVYIDELSDGVYVRAAHEKYADIVGAKVLEINGVPLEVISEGADTFFGHENSMHALLVRPHVLSNLDAVNLISGSRGAIASLRVKLSGGRTVTRKITYQPWSAPWYSEKAPLPESWTEMGAANQEVAPLWRRNRENFYWREYDETDRILYFHYSQILEKENQSFAKFIDNLFDEYIQRNAHALVIDLRLNDGGSSDLYKPLLTKLIHLEDLLTRGRLYVLIGRSTYSAAMNLAVELEFWTDAIFVGEPSGSSINFVGENKFLTLPYSRIQASISDRYHQHGASDSTDGRIWLAPDIAAPFSSTDLARNQDPAMDAVKKQLRQIAVRDENYH